MNSMCPEGGGTVFLRNIVSIYMMLEQRNQILKTFCIWDTENVYGLSDKNI